MERYACSISRLPILNVDEERLAWGAAVAETLRGMSNTSRMSGVRSGMRKSQIRREEQASAREARFASWKEIEDSMAQARVAMTRKDNPEL